MYSLLTYIVHCYNRFTAAWYILISITTKYYILINQKCKVPKHNFSQGVQLCTRL